MEYAAIYTHFEYKARSYYVLNSSNLVFLISRNTMKQTVTIIAFGGTRTQPLICVGCSVHYWVSCANDRGGFLSLHLCRHTFIFEALAYVLAHFDTLTHVVILVSSAFIFQRFAEV